jgi:hypothetical protein
MILPDVNVLVNAFTKLPSLVENLVEFCSGRRVACRP